MIGLTFSAMLLSCEFNRLGSDPFGITLAAIRGMGLRKIMTYGFLVAIAYVVGLIGTLAAGSSLARSRDAIRPVMGPDSSPMYQLQPAHSHQSIPKLDMTVTIEV